MRTHKFERQGRWLPCLGMAIGGWLLLATSAHAQAAPPIVTVDVPDGYDIVVANAGSSAIKAVILNFIGTDPAPVWLQATGFIQPGQQVLAQRPWQGAPARTRVKVISFNVQTLQAAGITVGTPTDLVADAMVELLFFHVVRDSQDLADFEAAYANGQSYRGIDQSKAWGGTVESAAIPQPGGGTIQVDAGLGQRVPQAVLDDAVANPTRISGYGQLVNPGAPASPLNPARHCLTLRDRGTPWHPLFNSLVFKAGCP